MTKVGVLALQGSIVEHIKSLSCIEGINPVEVKESCQLDSVSGLIIPGGESTTIGKLLRDFGLLETIVKKAQEGMPIWGTCAGMILMAKKIIDEDYIHLGIMDIAVRRNAYGSQLDSFCTSEFIPEVSEKPIPLIFIRAPWVEETWGRANVITKLNDRIIAVQQDNLLATSFHPELSEDLSFHIYFSKMAEHFSNKI